MAEEITTETIQKVNIKNLSLNKDLGRLMFKESLPYLERVQKLLNEFDELNYKEDLSPEEISLIDSKKSQFVKKLNQLQQFDIGQAESQQAHDNLEKQFIDFYNNISRELRTQLVFLRQQASLKSRDVQELQRQQKATLEAEKEYKSLTEKLNEELEVLKERKEAIGTAHGEVATKVLAHHFAKQANDYTEDAKKWLEKRLIFYWILLAVIIANLIGYLLLFILNKLGISVLSPKDIFTLEYGIVKLALISLLYYGMYFSSRNYNVSSNLAAVNKHRKNVAQTLEDFLATNPDGETRSQMIRQGTEAMFKHLPIGYLRKDDRENNASVTKIFTSILKQDQE